MSGVRWIPMESNPEVMTEWARKAGLDTKQYEFSDVYGFDEDILGFVSQPVKAIVLLFPDELHAPRRMEDERIKREGQPPVDASVIWIKQTIGNACGTMGILHALLNADIPVAQGSWLATLKSDCQGKDGFERAKLLETSAFLSEVHDQAARTGQTAVPATLDTKHHYTAFVEAVDQEDISKKRLIELDGECLGPIDRGECTDLLRDSARAIQEKFLAHTTNTEFTTIALTPVVLDDV